MRRVRAKVPVSTLVGFFLVSPIVSAAALDDAAILAIFDQANTADIWTARIGVKRAQSEEVRALARMVTTDHEAVQHRAREVARKLGVIPLPPDDDTSIARQAQAVAVLQTKSGAEFDRAYLRHELAFHRATIQAVRTTLLPATKSEELRALIRETLPGFEHHLAVTETVAKKLGVEPGP